MKILALEPYYGGSHRAFLDQWGSHSCHQWTLLTLPPNKWKWRMRHAAWTFARQVESRLAAGESWDLVLVSDMLDLAQFKGLIPSALHPVAHLVYFHENQLTYPVRAEKERDLHFALTNFSTALTADSVWFNSSFHRDSFLGALPALFKRMPDHRPAPEIERIHRRSEVHPPGVLPLDTACLPRAPGPVRILWAARWEHDKAPETFFAALRSLEARGVEFRLSVLGERFRQVPPEFDAAHRRFADRLDHWGYQSDPEHYRAALAHADLYVSTARHEFFGISAVEAVTAGAYPVLPRRLSYPEVMAPLTAVLGDDLFYTGGVRPLTRKLAELAQRVAAGTLWPTGEREVGRRAMQCYAWPHVARLHDDALERVFHTHHHGARATACV